MKVYVQKGDLLPSPKNSLMRLISTLFLFLFLFSQCKSDPFTTTCYEVSRERMGRKTVISFSVTTDVNTTHGEQSTVVSDETGKVLTSAFGNFKGTCLNGLCLVDYNYESQGLQKIAEEEFKLRGDTMFLTAGSYRLEDGKEYMKERGLFNVTLFKLDCPEKQ